MGKLIDRRRREKAARQRAERKTRILFEALASFEKLPYVEVTLDSIGQRAQVDRGVASMYFRSKEELFLLVLKRELEDWYEELETTLRAVDESLSEEQVAGLLTDSILNRPMVTRLLSLMPVVLEQNLDAMEAFRFQRWRRDRMVAVGGEIDRALERSVPGAGIHTLHLAQLIAACFDPVARPRGMAALDQGDPDFEVLMLDAKTELRSLLTVVLAKETAGQIP